MDMNIHRANNIRVSDRSPRLNVSTSAPHTSGNLMTAMAVTARGTMCKKEW